jgi:nucleotide-binding universal stress UspA family protein
MCEPIHSKAFYPAEIPALVKSRGVGRVILTAQGGQSGTDYGWKIFTDQLLRSIDVPTCVIGGLAFPEPVREVPVGRISLALSLKSDAEVALGFASRFAQERHSRLAILHVFNEGENAAKQDRTPLRVASLLPASTLREAELFCPLEIIIREGDAANEILKYDAATNQDFIILRSPGPPRATAAELPGVSQRIIKEARCPVIILGQATTDAAHKFQKFEVIPKPPERACSPSQC